MSEWMPVKKDNPCPICGKPDYCTLTINGRFACCMRTESSVPMKNGGWRHKIDSDSLPKRPRKQHIAKKRPVLDCKALQLQYVLPSGNRDVRRLSGLLGVSEQSLHRLGIGMENKNFTFPMFDGLCNIVGFRTRTPQHRKFAITGSKNGLFIPTGSPGRRLFICEGPTDCAALLDMGFYAIGRASCRTGKEYVRQYFIGTGYETIIVADNDEPKERPDGTISFPGQEGADDLANYIKLFTSTVRVIKPPHHKDIRAWYRAGAVAVAGDIEALIDNTESVK